MEFRDYLRLVKFNPKNYISEFIWVAVTFFIAAFIIYFVEASWPIERYGQYLPLSTSLYVGDSSVFEWLLLSHMVVNLREREQQTKGRPDEFEGESLGVPEIKFRESYGHIGFRAFPGQGVVIRELEIKSIKSLPEDSEKKKKRKRALLLFLRGWKDLKSEVKGLLYSLEAEHGEQPPTPKEQVSRLGKVLTAAKGPLGLAAVGVALVAGLLAYLNTSAVTVVIANQGCDPIMPRVSFSTTMV